MAVREISWDEVLQAGAVIFGPEFSTAARSGGWHGELKAAYRRRALETHPDRAQHLGRTESELAAEFRAVASAYELLTAMRGGGAAAPPARAARDAPSAAATAKGAERQDDGRASRRARSGRSWGSTEPREARSAPRSQGRSEGPAGPRTDRGTTDRAADDRAASGRRTAGRGTDGRQTDGRDADDRQTAGRAARVPRESPFANHADGQRASRAGHGDHQARTHPRTQGWTASWTAGRAANGPQEDHARSRARASSRRGATGQSATEAGRETTNRATTDRGTTDRETTDRGTTDRGTTDRETTDRGTTDRETTDRETTDRTSTGRGRTGVAEAARLRWRSGLPARRLRLAEFLYYSGRLAWADFVDAISWQRRQRPEIGRIAVDFGFLQRHEVLEILTRRRIEQALAVPFGEFAVRHGYLTSFQVLAVLGQQLRLQRPLGQYFVERGLVSEPELDELRHRILRHNARWAA